MNDINKDLDRAYKELHVSDPYSDNHEEFMKEFDDPIEVKLSDQSKDSMNSFFIVNEDEVNGWLKDAGNKICFKIYAKQNVVYSKSLPKDIDGNTIMSFITDWKETNKLPSTHTRYWFLCFYLEWKL